MTRRFFTKARRLQGVYAIEHVPSGYQYIGSSSNIAKRWQLHQGALSKGHHYCALLQTSWNCHEPRDFVLNVLEQVRDSFSLTVREQAWLDRTPLRFNHARSYTRVFTR